MEALNMDLLYKFFLCGLVLSQTNRRLSQPAINIYTDKDSGKPKGDATLSYDEPACARAAVEHFNGGSRAGRLWAPLLASYMIVYFIMHHGGVLINHGEFLFILRKRKDKLLVLRILNVFEMKGWRRTVTWPVCRGVVCWFPHLFLLSVHPGKEFQGRRLNVSMARRKTVPGFMRGGMTMRGGPNMIDRGGRVLLHTHRELVSNFLTSYPHWVLRSLF